MSKTAAAETKLRSKAGSRRIVTIGEIFPDGKMLELVSGLVGTSQPQLLFWDGAKARVAPRIEFGDYTYEGPDLAPSLYRATRFPKDCQKFGSARDLLKEIASLFAGFFDFPDPESRLLACFCFGTWLADRLSVAPSLVIFAPDQGLGIEVLRLLACVCRRPLMLAQVTPCGLRSLPMQLTLSLLIHGDGLKVNLQRLLCASSYRGLHLPGTRGSVVDLYGPKVILAESDLASGKFGEEAIQISFPPSSQWQVLDDERRDDIANHFQSRLLMYRLQNCTKVRESQADMQFTLSTRRLARALAACFPGDPDLARDTILLLRPQDEEIRAQRFLDVTWVIVEILLGEIHSREKKQVRVEEIAKNASALLRSRGEITEFSAEEIGWKLKSLGIRRHTNSAGRQVTLDRDTSRRVHSLAQTFGLPSSQNVQADCADCAVPVGTVAK